MATRVAMETDSTATTKRSRDQTKQTLVLFCDYDTVKSELIKNGNVCCVNF